MLIKRSFCFLVLTLLLTGFATGQVSEKDAVAFAKRISPSILDSSLAKGHFSDWLSRILGQSTIVKWEMNDCGEQVGNPAIDKERDLPVCVGVYVDFIDGRKLEISVLVGTNNKGLTGSAAIYDIYLESHGQTRTIKRLSDLERALKGPPK